jgi:putative ABC transport system permease protein
MEDRDPTARQAEDVINDINEVLLAKGITADFTNWPDFNDVISGFLLAFQVILYLAAGLIAAVGALGLLTSLSMSVFERQKEIGVMRSVGASSGAVATQFLIEGLVIGIAAWIIGVPISYVLKEGLVQALNFQDTFEIGYPPITLVIGLVGMIVIVTLASLVPSLAAARKTVSDILRYQ